MKFGIMLNHEYPKTDDLDLRIDQLIELVNTARDLGYGSVFGLHHYLSSLATIQPLPLLARLIPESGDMTLGTGIYIPTLEHPVQLAENWASLDHLSGGRMVLGVGAGYRSNEFDAFGVDRKTRWSRLRETIELLRELWSGEIVHHDGTFFKVEGESVSLVPKQPGGPPIWIGANSEKTIRWSAEFGDSWIAPPNVKMRWAKGHLGFFKEALAEAGKEPEGREYALIREVYVADSDEQAIAEADEFIRAEYAEYSVYGKEVEYWRTMYHELQQKAFLFGSADTVAEKIEDLASAGFNHFLIRTSWSGMPFERVIESVTRFAQEVMPRFQEARV